MVAAPLQRYGDAVTDPALQYAVSIGHPISTSAPASWRQGCKRSRPLPHEDMEATESEVQLIHYLIQLGKGKKMAEIKPLDEKQVKACLNHVRFSSIGDRSPVP